MTLKVSDWPLYVGVTINAGALVFDLIMKQWALAGLSASVIFGIITFHRGATSFINSYNAARLKWEAERAFSETMLKKLESADEVQFGGIAHDNVLKH